MKIIIPMAGQSRRFNEKGFNGHKALLNTGNKKMIEHVVEMFSDDDEFYFIINEKHSLDIKDIKSFLINLKPKTNVEVIKQHEKGPVYSTLLIDNIKDDSEIIITYCDFTLAWDYEAFKRSLYGVDGSIVSFKGFHPASFGETLYAYIKVKDQTFLELREKRNFTDDRTKEEASAGIYYFKSWGLYKKYAKKALKYKDKILSETYVSLLYNHMKKDKLLINTFLANKFICLGTPSDYLQFQYWWKVFKKFKDIKYQEIVRPNSTIMIPAAGKGSRFKQIGYRTPKPFIKVNGKPMIQRALESLPKSEKVLFLSLQKTVEKHDLNKKFMKFHSNLKNIEVKKVTSGQASTCLIAKDFLNPNSELFISSCDYEHIYDESEWNKILEDKTIDAAIWTYRLGSGLIKNPKAFAYCELFSNQNIVSRVVEKETISNDPGSDPLVVGTFWFRKSKDMIFAAEEMIKKDIKVNNEFYIGTSINELINLGKKIVIFDVLSWVSFGDPFELDVYDYWKDYFDNDYEC